MADRTSQDACYQCLDGVTCETLPACVLFGPCFSDPCFLDPETCSGGEPGPQPVDHSHTGYGDTDETTGYVFLDGVRYPALGITAGSFSLLGNYLLIQFRCSPVAESLAIFLDAPPPDGLPTGRVRTIVGVPGASKLEEAETLSGAWSVDGDFLTGSGTTTDTAGSGATHTYIFRVARTPGLAGTLHFSGDSPQPIGANEVLLQGFLTDAVANRIEHVVDTHPEVDTLVFGCWAGASLEAVSRLFPLGRKIRAAGLRSRLPARSGLFGISLFLAGVERTVDAGVDLLQDLGPLAEGSSIVQVGPYAEGEELSYDHACPDDPFHADVLAYYRDMLPEPGATELYCLGASSKQVRRVSRSELVGFGVIAE